MQNDLEIHFLKQKIEDLERAMNMQSSTTAQMMDMLRVELEENDDPEAALELVKEFSNEDG